MVFGTSNKTVLGAVQAQSDANFKTVNNLLSLQENHVEEFFQYHGELFLKSLEKLMEDVIREHLGWLIIWGNIFGGALGLISQAVGYGV